MEHEVKQCQGTCGEINLSLLTLTHEELMQLEPFLESLGVRCRITISDGETCIIQAENPYRVWAGHPDAKKIGDEAMTPFSISCYKR